MWNIYEADGAEERVVERGERKGRDESWVERDLFGWLHQREIIGCGRRGVIENGRELQRKLSGMGLCEKEEMGRR